MRVSIAATDVAQPLAFTTRLVFDRCAPVYLYEDRHWAPDTEVIRPLLGSSRLQTALDAGCGPGWHLEWLAHQETGVCRIVGIDNSPKMLAIARARLAKVNVHSRVDLQQADFRALPFRDSQFGLVLCLNNGIGNVCGATADDAAFARTAALLELRRVLTPLTGALVLSVYNRRYLREDIAYGEVFVLDRSLSRVGEGDLVVRYCDPGSGVPGGIPYFSHWFTSEEITKLFAECGLQLMQLHEVDTRICAVGRRDS
jgi:ubiquinone/menaquinone biosynthesis C-methylase UbiE